MDRKKIVLLIFLLIVGSTVAVGIVRKNNHDKAGIVLTFDDRAVESWYSARDLFKKYDAKATFFVTKYHKLNQEKIEMLKNLKQDGHEVGSHGLNHIRATTFIKENSLKAYLSQEILPTVELMNIDGLGPTSFAYPYGSRKKEIDKALLEEFNIIRGTAPTKKVKIKDQDLAYCTSGRGNKLVFGVGIDGIYENTVKDILDGIDRAKKNGEILTLYAHKIVEVENKEKYVVGRDKIETILKYAADNGMKFYTISEIAQ